jgi:hypothetical protein
MRWSRPMSAARLLAALLLVGAAAGAAAADFEGVIESKVTVSGGEGGGSSRTFISRLGTRQEMVIGPNGQAMTMVTVMLKEKPGVAYMVNDDQKTYAEIDFASMRQAAAKSTETYQARRLGEEKVAGFSCVHGQVEGSKGDHWEVWTTKEISGGESYWASQSSRREERDTAGLYRAMKEAGLDGWPVKVVIQSKGSRDGAVTWEATKIERKSLPGSLFSLAGYTKSEGAGPMAAMRQMKLSPEQQKGMEEAMEAMKKMPPEQRKRMEEMMKGMQGQGEK